MDHPTAPASPAASGEPAPRLDIALLGRFVASVDGHEITAAAWPSLRATHLTQLLSLQVRHRL